MGLIQLVHTLGACPQIMTGTDQQMYFIVHLQNNKSTKSQPTDIFFLFWEYMQISQLQQTIPLNKEGEVGGALQSNFHKACLSAGTLEPKQT